MCCCLALAHKASGGTSAATGDHLDFKQTEVKYWCIT